jgi:hypothetical protein
MPPAMPLSLTLTATTAWMWSASVASPAATAAGVVRIG